MASRGVASYHRKVGRQTWPRSVQFHTPAVAGIELPPGSTWETIIEANQAADEVFVVKAGTHTGQTAPLRSGQKLLFEGGVTANGTFSAACLVNADTHDADGIEVGGIDPNNRPDIHSYGPGFQVGVIKLRRQEQWTSKDAYIHDLLMHDCYSGVDESDGWGVDMGERTTLRRVDIRRMGQAGVSWSGKVTAFENPATAGGLVDDCDLHDNGRVGADTGGISKMSGGPGSRGRVLKNSRLSGNRRTNVWCDFLGRANDGSGQGQHGQWYTGVLEVINCDIFEVGAGTLAEAVFLEVTGGVWLHHSRIYASQSVGGGGLDGAQVICHNAGFNTVEDNIIYDCGTRSFGINQSARYDASGRLITCESNAFRRNKVYAIDTAVVLLTGLSQIGAGAPYQLLEGGGGGTWDARTQGNNVWEDNEYFVLETLHNQTGGALFRLDEGFGTIAFAAWQAAGFDAGPAADYSTFPASAIPDLPDMPMAA